MYQVFLGYVPLPIPPSKITTKIGSRNQTIELVDGREINLLKDKGLTEIEFDFMLPHQSYPFTTVMGDLSNAINDFLPLNMGNAGMNTAILYYLEYLKKSKDKFTLVITRMGPNGGRSGLGGVVTSALNTLNLYNSTIDVTLESFSIDEDAEAHGLDFMVSVSLKQYETWETLIVDPDNLTTKRVRP